MSENKYFLVLKAVFAPDNNGLVVRTRHLRPNKKRNEARKTHKMSRESATYYILAAGREGDGEDVARVPIELLDLNAVFDSPDNYGLVIRTRHLRPKQKRNEARKTQKMSRESATYYVLAAGREGDGEDVVGVPLELLDLNAVFNVPNNYGVVLGTRHLCSSNGV